MGWPGLETYTSTMWWASRREGRWVRKLFPFICLLFLAFRSVGWAQGNYEIQVYGADTVAPRTTMVELHSNFTVDGSKAVPGSIYAADGSYPTTHQQHETVEITQGLTKWSE